MTKNSGEELAKTTMQGSVGYGLISPTFGDGKIFVNIGNGSIQAFDYKTLKSLWIYKDESGSQTISPITYYNGFIYTGFYKGDNQDSDFICIKVEDIDKNNELEEKSAFWKYTHNGGFYWAGSLVIGNTVLVGSNSGVNGSNLYQFNKFTGEVIESFALNGDQRSSISYNEILKKIYFTTKSCKIYSADVSEDYTISNLKSSTISDNLESTSTPVVYNNRLYVGIGSMGQNGKIAVINATTLETIYFIDTQSYPQCSILLSTAYLGEDNTVYIYTTYNDNPGGIKVIIDKPGQAEENIKDLYIPNAEMQNFCISNAEMQNFCISNIICDQNGTFYYKNDSGYIFAITHNDIADYKLLLKEKINQIFISSDYNEENLKTRNDLISKFNQEIETLKTTKDLNTKYNELFNNLSVLATVNDIEINSTLINNKEYNINQICFELIAKNSENKVLKSTNLIVKLNGYTVSEFWSDNTKATYPLNFTQYKNTVEIIANYNNKTTTKIYNIFYVEKPIEFTISLNAFTIGCGYILEPTKITLTDDYLLELANYHNDNDDINTIKEQLNIGYVLKYELYKLNLTINDTDCNQSFYLNTINGFKHSNNIPEILKDKIKESGFLSITEPSNYDTLSSFDYTMGSGFMYQVNNSTPNIGMGQYKIKGGDDINIVFSLAYGADILEMSFMGIPFFEVVDRTELSELIAESKDYKNTYTYKNAINVISTLNISQEELNNAYNALFFEVNK